MGASQVYENIAITGASSGLGRALAIVYAHPGAVLHLTGRHAARLAEVAATTRALGATTTETTADVTDAAAMAAWIIGCGKLDLVIANAGISSGPGAANVETPDKIRALFATNIDGVFNTVLPAMTVIAAQPPGLTGARGRIAIVGSIAGLTALPISPSYSATKAALDTWVTASAHNAAKDGIGLTIIRPGFIHTGITAGNPFKMPGIMDAGYAAQIIRAGLTAGKTHITFPWWLALAARFSRLLPIGMFDKVQKKPPG
jgi:NADP-dependent 3-hydroxy acid dehydrogenase YdfG